MERILLEGLKCFGLQFYIVLPRDTFFATPRSIPNYLVRVIPFVYIISVIEILVSLWLERRSWRLYDRAISPWGFNDTVTSLSQAIFSELGRGLIRTTQISCYLYVYDRWSLTTFASNSLETWFLGFLLVDFFYYWIHRTNHTFNFLWVFHQVHHSSEVYNLSMAYRDSVISTLLNEVLYTPLALILPPTVLLVHLQLSRIYQIWIHNQLISKLGPVERIFNTPSHHRVHHGINSYCWNKNFGGTLIIWDKIFGTFLEEEDDVVCGTMEVQSYSVLDVQFGAFINMLKSMWKTEGLWNKLKTLWKIEKIETEDMKHDGNDLADRERMEKYNSETSIFRSILLYNHFTMVFFAAVLLLLDIYRGTVKYILYAFVVTTCFNIGFVLDKRWYAPILEILRCTLLVLLEFYYGPIMRVTRLPRLFHKYCSWAWQLFFLGSSAYWIRDIAANIKGLRSLEKKFD